MRLKGEFEMKHMSIRQSIVFLFAIVSISLCCLCINAENTIDRDEAFEFAKDFLSEYYFAKDQYADYDFSAYVSSENFLNFINQKTASDRYRYIVYDTDDKQNYKLEFSLIETEEHENYIILDIAVKASFRYKYYSRNSSIGDETLIIVGYENGKYIVKDWYTYLNAFDVFARGEIATISDPNYWDVSPISDTKTQALEEESQRIYQYFSDMKAEMARNNDEVPTVEEQELISTASVSYSINKTALTNWAKVNYNKEFPISGNPSLVAYEDYSKIGTNNWDCTNFASHSLLAGGAVMDYYPNAASVIDGDDKYWFMKSSNIRSRSWSGVGDFYNFITTCSAADGISDAKIGPYGKGLPYANIVGNISLYEEGDMIQFSNGSRWSHTSIIVGFANVIDSDNEKEPIIVGRSSPSIIDDYIRQSERNVSYDRRILKILGYYN